jgi:hypothetical protein
MIVNIKSKQTGFNWLRDTMLKQNVMHKRGGAVHRADLVAKEQRKAELMKIYKQRKG